jgi:hypothetical protein
VNVTVRLPLALPAASIAATWYVTVWFLEAATLIVYEPFAAAVAVYGPAEDGAVRVARTVVPAAAVPVIWSTVGFVLST